MMDVFLKQKDIFGFAALAIIIVILPVFVESKYYFIVLNVIGLNTIVVVGLNLLIGFAGTPPFMALVHTFQEF
jgi:ABC-type branched-subunit amino acid transport system permease subunit